MRKILITIIVSVVALLCLTGCSGKKDLIFTEYVEGLGMGKALEIYNPLKDDVDLSTYSIAIYKDGQTLMTYKIKLKGTLKSKECYVVAYNESPQELLDKADLITEDLYFTGDDPIQLLNGDRVISSFAIVSALSINYGKDTTLVKLDPESNLGKTEYIKSDWIEYLPDDYSNLGTVEHKMTLQDLLDGPKLTEEMLNTPFFPEGTNSQNFLTQTGTGGAVEVKLKACGDGDTTYFYYPEEWDYLELDEEKNRVRYFGVDTPESSANVAPDPWGKTAANYTNKLLMEAETIHIQSLKDYSMSGSFDRLMALIWVDGVLLQNEIIKMGYSEFTHSTLPFAYEGFPITSYLKYNANVAELKGKGIWGEKDPLWDYKNNRPK